MSLTNAKSKPKLEANVRAAKHSAATTPVILAGIFLLALALRLYFNFGASHINTYASCDASEYLRNAQALGQVLGYPLSFWSNCWTALCGQASPAELATVKSGLEPLKGFYISGPIFPAFLLVCYSLFGLAVEPSNWLPPLLVQSILSALACPLLALAGNYAFNRKTGYLAGFIAALYPAFIINTGRLYSESFAAFLISLMICITCRGFKEGGNPTIVSFLNGFLACSLQLTRSVMFLLSLALLPIIFIQQRTRRPFVALALFGLAFAICAMPWLAWQKLTVGKCSLVVDRVGHYNFFTGNNVDTLGWLSYPYPDGRGIEEKNFLQLAHESFSKSPSRFLKLMADKPARLYKFPWNDFRTSIGPITMPWQVAFHQLIVMFALIGLGTAFFVNSSGNAPSKSQLNCRTFVASIWLLHLIYLLFITVPRYNLTSMPALILFAAAGIMNLIQLTKNNALLAQLALFASLFSYILICSDWLRVFWVINPQAYSTLAVPVSIAIRFLVVSGLFACLWSALKYTQGYRVLAKITTALIILFITPLAVLPLRADGRTWEQSNTIAPGSKINLTLAPPSRTSQSYLLIDSAHFKDFGKNMNVSVNNKPIEHIFIPSLSLSGDPSLIRELRPGVFNLEGEYIFDCMTQASGISNLDLRQWILVPIAAGELATKNGQIDIALHNNGTEPERFYYTIGKSNDYLDMPSLTDYSWEKAFYAVESSENFTDTRYDIKLPHTKAQSSETSARPLIFLLSDSSSEPISKINTVNLEPQTLAAQGTSTDTLNLERLKNPSTKSLWLLRLNGEARSTAPQGLGPSLEIECLLENGKTYLSPWTPRQMPPSSLWQTFDYSLVIPANTLPSPVKAIRVKFYAQSPVSKQLNNLPSKMLQASGGAQFNNLKLELFSMPQNPLTGQPKIH